jgi:hypothetical protein
MPPQACVRQSLCEDLLAKLRLFERQRLLEHNQFRSIKHNGRQAGEGSTRQGASTCWLRAMCVCVRARGSSLRVLLRVGVCGLRRVVDSLVGCEQVCDTGKTLTIKFLLGQDRAHAQTVFIWCCLRHRLRHEAHIVPNRRMRGQVLWRWWNAGLIHAAFLRHVSRPRETWPCSLPGAW